MKPLLLLLILAIGVAFGIWALTPPQEASVLGLQGGFGQGYSQVHSGGNTWS